MSLSVAIVIVLVAALVAALAFALVRRAAGGPLILDSGRGRPMVTVTGTLFAVVLAFVILAAFQTYDGARSGAQTEAEAVLDMARAAALFPPGQRDELRGDLVCYGRAVIDQEWPAMRDGDSSPFVDDWIAAYRGAFGRLALRSTREQLVFQELINLAATRTSGRQQRLSDDTPAVPTTLWLALIFAGCVAVTLHLGMADPRERPYVHSLLVAGLASVVASGLLIVYFLDHPYQPHAGGIQLTAMRSTLVTMKQLEPGLRLPCGVTGRPIARA
jgi:hypothetical protein